MWEIPLYPAGQPSWTRISERGNLHQWAITDIVHEYACPSQVTHCDVAVERSQYMSSRENPVIFRRSVILDRGFKMRLCTSTVHYRHCSRAGMSISSHSLLRSGCGNVSICKEQGNPIISRWSAILYCFLKMRLIISIGHNRHCSHMHRHVQLRSFTPERFPYGDRL